MIRIDAVVLDVDGTVATCPYDFDGMRVAVRRIAAAWGIDAATLGIRGIIEQIDAVASRLADDGAGFRREAEQAVVALEIEGAKQARVLPGAADALRRLRDDGIAVGLITRNCRAATDIVLRSLDHYDSLLTRDDVPRPKPDPEHVRRSLVELDSPPGRAIMVGDHSYDMQAGRAAGVHLCVGVRTGGGSDEVLVEAGAGAVIDSLADLPDWLRGRRERSL